MTVCHFSCPITFLAHPAD